MAATESARPARSGVARGAAERRGAGWFVAAAAIALVTATPVLVAVASVFTPGGEAWAHIAEHVLARVVGNTVSLVVAVALITLVLGVSLAWLTAVCEFPGRRLASWALLLPLAVPGYVLAFALGGFFDFQGPFRAGLETVGVRFESWPSLGGGVASTVCLGLTLYPYVYLLARQAFLSQGLAGLEVAQSLGYGPIASFVRASLPMARPWILGGLSLVVMETLADFGTVKVFNFDTLTTAIYSAWYGLFSLTAALQLSVVLIVLVLVALVAERRARGRARYALPGGRAAFRRIELTGWRRAGASACAFSVLGIAFVLPAALMLFWSVRHAAAELDPRYVGFAVHSVTLGLAAAALLLVMAAVLAYAQRYRPGRAMGALQRVATLGYALPGTVLAVGFVLPVAALGNVLNRALGAVTGGAAGIVVTGTLATLLLAYAARFLAVAYQPVDNGLHRITRNLEDAARGMGREGGALFAGVHWPLLRPALATAALLVFVDVMKELPITLMTRPFGWDTLAVRVFQLTTEGEFQRASLPALTIVVAGLAPIWLINRRSLRHA